MSSPASSPQAASCLEESHWKQAFLLATWGAAWMVVQGLLSARGLGASVQVGGLLLGLLLAFGGAYAFLRERFLRLLTSIPFAVTQILFMGLMVLLGILVPQEQPAEDYLERFGPLLGDWIRLTHLGDLFHSLWFSALLALLALSMLAVAWKRRPYPMAKLGFLLVHAAPTLVFAGGLWNQFGGVKAFTELKVGQGTYTFRRTHGGTPYVLPGFQVKLERFEVRRRSEAEYRLIVSARTPGQSRGGSESLAVVEGERGRLSKAALEFEVERLIPNGVEFEKHPNPPKEAQDPDVLAVMLGIGRPEPLLGYLLRDGEEGSRKDEPLGRFTVLFRPRLDPTLLATLRPRPPQAQKIVVDQGGQTREFAAQPGDVLVLGDATLRVRALYPDFQVLRDGRGNPIPSSRSQEPRDPWLELEYSRPGGAATRVLLSARQPEYTHRLNEPNLPKGMRLSYVREGEEWQRRFVVFSREGNRVDLVQDGAVARTETWALNRPFLVEKGLSVTAVGLYDRYYPVSQEAKVQGRPVIRVRLRDPLSGATERVWLDPREEKAQLAFAGRVALRYALVPPEPKDFRSTLVIADPHGHELARQVVGVNEPLVHGGHAFRQSRRTPRDAEASAILVVDQPGAWLAWLGYAMLLIGIAWMFYLKPWLKGRAATHGAGR
jgi:hypothetical protein